MKKRREEFQDSAAEPDPSNLTVWELVLNLKILERKQNIASQQKIKFKSK